MITSTELRTKLEDVIDMLNSDYTPEQWVVKAEVDAARYAEAKKVHGEVDTIVEQCDIDWDDNWREDYKAINQLMDKLVRHIDMMEDDLNN